MVHGRSATGPLVLPLVVVQGSTGWHAEHASSATCPVHQPFFQCHMLALFILTDCAFHLTGGCQRCGMHSCVRDRCTQSILQTFVGASQMACSALALCLCVLDQQGLIESQVRCVRRLGGGPFVGKGPVARGVVHLCCRVKR